MQPSFMQPVVQAEAAREHAVAERHLRPVARHHARHLREARDAVAPHVHVVGVVAHHDGLAGGARRGVQLLHFGKRHGEKPVGERLAQHALVRERELAHVLERADVAGRHAERVHALAVPRHAPVGPRHLRLELLQLDGADPLARGAFHVGRVDGQAGEVACGGRGQGGPLDGQVHHAPHLPPAGAAAPPTRRRRLPRSGIGRREGAAPTASGLASIAWSTSSTGSWASSASACATSFTDSAM